MDPTLDQVPVDTTAAPVDSGSSWNWESTVNGWGKSIFGLAGQYLGAATQLQAQQQAMKMASVSPYGTYWDGQSGVYRQMPGTVGGMSGGTILLIGAALVAVMLLKD